MRPMGTQISPFNCILYDVKIDLELQAQLFYDVPFLFQW